MHRAAHALARRGGAGGRLTPLKIVLTPLLIAAATLAGRRWGPLVGGWLVGLPLTSAPITFFVALEQGTAFAAVAALGTLAGTVSQAAFAVTYGRLARRTRWPLAVAAGSAAFAVATLGLWCATVPRAALLVLAVGVLVVALAIVPRAATQAPARSVRAPRGDLPLRMIVATAIVVALTAAAPALGARLTGLLSPFPLYAAVLAAFAHAEQGAVAAVEVLRGLLVGLFAFVVFFFAVAVLIEAWGTGPAFAVAAALALAAQGGSLWALGRGGRATRTASGGA